MTFKSTSIPLAAAEALGFSEWKPLRYDHPKIRTILVTSEITELLSGKKVETGFPDGRADKVLGIFRAGHFMTVSRKSAEGADLERLEDVTEVWALCIRTPRPGWRLFGRFLAQDVFVATHAHDRTTLNGRKTYTEYAQEAADNWDKLGLSYVSSTELTSYLSGSMYRDVDESDE